MNARFPLCALLLAACAARASADPAGVARAGSLKEAVEAMRKDKVLLLVRVDRLLPNDAPGGSVALPDDLVPADLAARALVCDAAVEELLQWVPGVRFDAVPCVAMVAAGPRFVAAFRDLEDLDTRDVFDLDVRFLRGLDQRDPAAGTLPVSSRLVRARIFEQWRWWDRLEEEVADICEGKVEASSEERLHALLLRHRAETHVFNTRDPKETAWLRKAFDIVAPGDPAALPPSLLVVLHEVSLCAGPELLARAVERLRGLVGGENLPADRAPAALILARCLHRLGPEHRAEALQQAERAAMATGDAELAATATGEATAIRLEARGALDPASDDGVPFENLFPSK